MNQKVGCIFAYWLIAILVAGPACRLTAIVVAGAACKGGELSRPVEGPFGERLRFEQTADGVRLLVDEPKKVDGQRPTRVVFYTLPNGNTIEQTMGCKLEKGMDWHFDIQHIGAQTRLLREVDSGENIVVVYLEAGPVKSWPAWRKAHEKDGGGIIRGIVARIVKETPGSSVKATLMAHSGGGSFVFGYINAAEEIGDVVDRIVFLDANYGFADSDRHGEKLLAWLQKDERRRLIVAAYDDRNITLDGKLVNKPDAGSYRASQRMLTRFAKDVTFEKSGEPAPFEVSKAMGGRMAFYIHPNVENKILHTVLVERNGFLHAMTLGTPLEGKWGGEFWAQRAYTKWIQPTPLTLEPTTRPAVAAKGFMAKIAALPAAQREEAIFQELSQGQVKFHTVEVRDEKGHRGIIEVSEDYLAAASGERIPMTPMTAQRIADKLGCVLPTRKIVDAVYAQAEVKLSPQPMTEKREAVESFAAHNEMIEKQRAGKAGLIAGIKKDIVITNRLKEKPKRVAIYGWHQLNGKAIQPLTIVHADTYVDYSHGVRLVKAEMIVDGKKMKVIDALKSEQLCDLVSDEGVIDNPVYPVHPVGP